MTDYGQMNVMKANVIGVCSIIWNLSLQSVNKVNLLMYLSTVLRYIIEYLLHKIYLTLWLLLTFQFNSLSKTIWMPL